MRRETVYIAALVVLAMVASHAVAAIVGWGVGYDARNAAQPGIERERVAACEVARASAVECAARLGDCYAANLSAAMALDVLAAREDGCARFLSLTPSVTYRLSHAGRPRGGEP